MHRGLASASGMPSTSGFTREHACRKDNKKKDNPELQVVEAQMIENNVKSEELCSSCRHVTVFCGKK